MQIYQDSQGRVITAMTILDREQALVIGFVNGDCIILDLLKQNKAHDLFQALHCSKPSVTPITAISTFPTQKKSSREKAYHTIVIIGDTAGFITRFFVKRSTKSNGNLKVELTALTRTFRGNPAYVMTVLSEKDFSIGIRQGIQVCHCEIHKDAKSVNLKTLPPIALLPVRGNDRTFFAGYADGKAAIYKGKTYLQEMDLGIDQIYDMKGIVTKNARGSLSYDLVVLRNNYDLVLITSQQTQSVFLAQSVLRINVIAHANIIILAYVTTDGAVIYSAINTQFEQQPYFFHMKTIGPKTITAMAIGRTSVFVATTNQIDSYSTLGATPYAQVTAPPSYSSTAAAGAAAGNPQNPGDMPAGPVDFSPGAAAAASAAQPAMMPPGRQQPYGAWTPISGTAAPEPRGHEQRPPLYLYSHTNPPANPYGVAIPAQAAAAAPQPQPLQTAAGYGDLHNPPLPQAETAETTSYGYLPPAVQPPAPNLEGYGGLAPAYF